MASRNSATAAMSQAAGRTRVIPLSPESGTGLVMFADDKVNLGPIGAPTRDMAAAPSEAAADPARPPAHPHDRAAVPAHPGRDHAGLRLLSFRLCGDLAPRLRVL